MECGICGILYDEDFMIPGDYGYGVCIDCAKALLRKIARHVERGDFGKAAEELAKAKLIASFSFYAAKKCKVCGEKYYEDELENGLCYVCKEL